MEDEKLEREAAKILFSSPSQEEEEVPSGEPRGPEVLFVCPFCNEEYKVSAELAGKKINCRNCREPCRVDSAKTKSKKRSGPPFWLGILIGVLIGVLLCAVTVTILKWVRVL